MRRLPRVAAIAITISLAAVGAVLAIRARRVPDRLEIQVATPLPKGAVVTPLDARTLDGPWALPDRLVVFTSRDARVLFVFERSGATVHDAVETLASAGRTRTFGQLTHVAFVRTATPPSGEAWFTFVVTDSLPDAQESSVDRAFVDTLRESDELRSLLESGDD